MEPVKHIPYKSCMVPNCKNTTTKAPGKLFLSVPKNAEVRKKWCIAMNRDKSKPLITLTSFYCCEDHFTLKDDLENYWQHELVGNVKKLRLRKGVVPHKFYCQEKAPPARASGKPTIVEENVEQIESYLAVTDPIPGPSWSNQEDSNDNVRILSEMAFEEESSESTPKQSFSTNEEICGDYSMEEEVDIEFKSQMLKTTLDAINKEPKLVIGVPKNTYYIVELLSAESDLTTRDILITFRKIRLNESFSILALQFGMSVSNVSRIFSRSVPVIANLMKELIVWMPKEKVRLHLPIPFRARYSKVQSIIDCLEIKIEKPTNSVHQALTWSQYKGCNTIKYLISCTPDGLINFISPGFDGRSSDVTIVEECGFLEKLEYGVDVMADGGFKNIANILQQRGCNLIRPPSVSSSSPSTAAEVKEAKRIAGLRIHVERVIGRLRDYSILLPHAPIDNDLVKVIDNIIIIVCGLVNIRDQL